MSIRVFFFFICTHFCLGNDSFLNHLLTRQQTDKTDYIPPSKWSIFDVFGADTEKDQIRVRHKNDQSFKSSAKPRGGWKKSEPYQVFQASQVETAKVTIPFHKSAASTGGLLPNKIFVLNSDRWFERWLSFRDRWALVNGHSGNFSVTDSSNPIRFRGADLGKDNEDGKLTMSWKRKLDVLPPRTRKTSLECRDVAFSAGNSEALSYGLSHLALWESIAMDKRLKMDDRILILDDSARPRQHWIDLLERSALGIPRDWDLISLGWFGESRKNDAVGDGSAFRVNPPFRIEEDGEWSYFYGGAHARLLKGRVIKRMVVALSKLVKPPKCNLFWPDMDVVHWANHTGVNYYAMKQPLFGLVKDVKGDFEQWVDHAVEGPALIKATEHALGTDEEHLPWSRGRSRYDVSSASRKKIRARLPASVKCRTIVNDNGIEREVCT